MLIKSKWIDAAAKALAQWNANLLQGRAVSSSAPSNGDILTWSSGSSSWGPQSRSATEATATADTTTTSTTDVLIGSMTLTPVAGDYLVFFSTTVDHSAQAVAVVISIYVGGVLKADSVRSPVPRFNGIGANSLSPMASTNGWVTVNGSQAIEIRWKTASGTATAHQRALDILRVL